MQELFNWTLEEYEKLSTITLDELQNANPTILKHKYKFREAQIQFYNPNILTANINAIMFYRYDGFRFIVHDKSYNIVNLKYAELRVDVKQNCIYLSNDYAFIFKNNQEQQQFIDYFNSYNIAIQRINKSLCEKSRVIFQKLSTNSNIVNAVNNLIDMFPADLFLSGGESHLLLVKLCVMDEKFAGFTFANFINQTDFFKELYPNHLDICDTINNSADLHDFYILLTQFNELIYPEYNVDYSYMNILTYLLINNEITKKYSAIWESEVGISNQFISDEEYIKYCYENNLIISEDEGHLSCLAYYLKYKNNSEDFLLKLYLEKITNILNDLKSITNKNLFAKNILRNRAETVMPVSNKITIDDVDLMTGFEFEELIAKLFSKMGYSTSITKGSGDQGIDVIAERNGNKYGIQCKCYSNTVSNSAIQEVVAGKQFYHLDKLIVITNNYFTKSAQELATANNVILWDREILKEKINNIFAE